VFDETKGIVPTEAGGRVVGQPGLYATGWIKRGATGEFLFMLLFFVRETLFRKIKRKRKLETQLTTC